MAKPVEQTRYLDEIEWLRCFNYLISVLALLVIIVLCMVPRSLRVEETKPQPPHILFILVDDMGFYDVPWHNPAIVAPVIHSLAKSGVILERHYVHSLCSPSRASILSGKYAFEIGRQVVLDGLQPTGLNLSLVLLPEYLRELGYATHAIGKWHLGFCNWDYTPTERGFDSFFGFYNAREGYYDKWFTDKGRSGFDFRNNTKVCLEAKGTYSLNQFTRRAIEILESSPPSVQKFIYFAVQNVHEPMEVPHVYLKPYDYVSVQSRKTVLAMVTALNNAIFDLVEKLKETGHYENTVIIFLSDNGGSPRVGSYNWPLRGTKGSLYEGGGRVPAFVHSPLLTNGGSKCEALIHGVDWLPTIISLAGGTPPNGSRGYNQWPVITGETNDTIRKEVVYQLVYGSSSTTLAAAIRGERYKLLIGKMGTDTWDFPPEKESKKRRKRRVRRSSVPSNQSETFLPLEPFDEFSGETVEYQLFDLTEDPEERIDLSEALPHVVRRLAERLHSHKDRYVPPDDPDKVFSGDPANFGGAWSPGFC